MNKRSFCITSANTKSYQSLKSNDPYLNTAPNFSHPKTSKSRKSKRRNILSTERLNTYSNGIPKFTVADFRKNGKQSLSVLLRNLSNVRYLGFSPFLSSNVLQNSHYAWSIPKSRRFDPKDDLKLNDNIYNIPSIKSNRCTTLGYGQRKDLRPTPGKGSASPAAYLIKSCFDINKLKGKGYSFGKRFALPPGDAKFVPGPGEYKAHFQNKEHGNIPIILKSRQCFFYDDDLKHKKATVSMQTYHPKFTLVEKNRFSGITFGIGNRPKMENTCGFPGPGSYNIPGNFDRGLKGKLALN